MSTSLTFSLDNQRHLEAAEGWLGLGLHLEANAELEKITPQLRDHPDVLELRWHIYAAEKKWEACMDIAAAIINRAPKRSSGWIHRSFALHELKRTQEAFDQLLPAVDRFPKVWTISYNLACYSSVLHNFDEAEKRLKQAFTLGGDKVKQGALDDPDLKPLWDSLGGTTWKRE